MAKLTFLKETLDAKRREQGSCERCALLDFLLLVFRLGVRYYCMIDEYIDTSILGTQFLS